MTYPFAALTNPFTDGELVDEAALQAGVIDNFNLLVITDTGWVPITGLSGSWVASANLAARQINHHVYLRGSITDASFSGSPTLLANLPTGIDPPSLEPHQIDTSGNATGGAIRTIRIDPDGSINVGSSVSASAALYLSTDYLTD